MMQGNIFDIKRYAIHDGPGIRTTVFLKGCLLRCRWCHNPESQQFHPVVIHQVCKLGDHEFTEERTVGYTVSAEELVQEIRKDYVFFEESGGGVTFSGGEPLCQDVFLVECLRLCRAAHIHTCVDTAGAVVVPHLEEICRYTDLFLYDIKTMNRRKFREYVGECFDEVCRNLKTIVNSGNRVIVRIPVIPGFNDDAESIYEIITYLQTFPVVQEVNLLPYHRTGADKYKRLGMTWQMGNFESLKPENLQEFREIFRTNGYQIT